MPRVKNRIKSKTKSWSGHSNYHVRQKNCNKLFL